MSFKKVSKIRNMILIARYTQRDHPLNKFKTKPSITSKTNYYLEMRE